MTQEKFLELADKWENIFLEWVPWAWKTYIVSKWREDNKDKKKIVTVSFTWLAAINVWGSTIHSTFKIFWNEYRFINKQIINWKEVDVLIIDEIWTVSCDLFSHIDRILQKSRWNNLPFWWMQIICVWDRKQIPPIFNMNDEEQKKRYEELKWNVLFFYSDSYIDWDFIHIFLSDNKRSWEVEYNDILKRARDWENVIDLFNHWSNDELIQIMPYNNQVDAHNKKMLDNINSKEYMFKWFIVWDFNLNNTLTPEELYLKIWAKIMITSNLSNWLVNWDLWYVLNINDEFIQIYSYRREDIFKIERYKFKNISYDNHWKEIIKWTFTQFPIKLAYALSCHKVQWLTLEKYVFHYNHKLSNELVYVALSRWINKDSVLIYKKE